MKRMLRATISVAVVLTAYEQVQAGTITPYTDRSTFVAGVGSSLTVEDFTNTSHLPISTGELSSSTNLPGIGITPGVIQPGVSYSTPVGTGNFFNIDLGSLYSGGFLDGFNPSTRDVTMTFDSPVSAFGFDIGSQSGSSTFDVTIQFVSAPDQNFNNVYPAFIEFFGWQSDSRDISSVVVGNNGGSYGFDFDNFTFDGDNVVVPEPTTATLVAVGLLAFAIRQRG